MFILDNFHCMQIHVSILTKLNSLLSNSLMESYRIISTVDLLYRDFYLESKKTLEDIQDNYDIQSRKHIKKLLWTQLFSKIYKRDNSNFPTVACTYSCQVSVIFDKEIPHTWSRASCMFEKARLPLLSGTSRLYKASSFCVLSWNILASS